MMLVAGTVPVKDFPLTCGPVSVSGDKLIIGGQPVECTQGTAAMVSAALATTQYLKLAPPQAVIAGDIGQGQGSRNIYEYLIETVPRLEVKVLALHYWLPDMAQTRRLMAAVDRCAERPVIVGDAASMYSAKAAGLAGRFDIFTPDSAETAFLADPDATHPAYVRFMVYNDMEHMPELIKTAYKHGNAARLMLVKGATDYIVRDGEILETVSQPDVPAMEAIGGTGDTITGMVAALVYAGLEPYEAAVIAARANRTAGEMARPTPATRVGEIIKFLPEVFKENLCKWSGVCTS